MLAEKIKKVKTFRKKAFYELLCEYRQKVHMYGKSFDYFPTTAIIFAYDSSSLEKLWLKLNEINTNLQEDLQIDMICVLNKGSIRYRNPQLKQTLFPFEPGCKLAIIEADAKDNLQRLYLHLMRILCQAFVKPINVLEYFPQYRSKGESI